MEQPRQGAQDGAREEVRRRGKSRGVCEGGVQSVVLSLRNALMSLKRKIKAPPPPPGAFKFREAVLNEISNLRKCELYQRCL